MSCEMLVCMAHTVLGCGLSERTLDLMTRQEQHTGSSASTSVLFAVGPDPAWL